MKLFTLNILFLFFSAHSYGQSHSVSGVVAVLGQAQVSQLNFGDIREMKVSGSVVSLQNHLPLVNVKKFVESGFPVYAKKAPHLDIQTCTEGVFVFLMGEGNALPQRDGAESYLSPTLLSFNCINK